MPVLLDTHTLIWAMEGDPRLTATAKRLLEDPAQVKIVSIVSGWEIAIKMGVGKLTLAVPFTDLFQDRLDAWGFKLLPIECPHLHRLLDLPRHHGDPFDRLIAAQSLSEDLALISCDAAFDAYDVRRIWQ